MKTQEIEKYIDKLYSNQNAGAMPEQQNLFAKKDYYDLLKTVIETVNENKDCSISELYQKLYEKSGVAKSVTDFIYKKEMAPGMVFSFGTMNHQETIILGNQQEVKLNSDGKIVPEVKEMTENTIFDLASITKLFTSLSILKLVEKGIINLDDKITKYDDRFINLKNVSIFDLLSFGVPLKTTSRIDKALSKEEAEEILFNIEIDYNNNNYHPYTDMGAMVLKYIIEKASSTNYYTFVEENILKKLNMTDTHVNIPKYKLDRVASTNLDYKFYKDGNVGISKFDNGVAYDPKAQIMGQANGNLSGHAGIFSTVPDIKKLAKGIINSDILNKKYIEMMAKNRTGKKYIENGEENYAQYLGFLCYSKNPIAYSTEVYHALSGKSIASAGWTGPQLTIDPVNEIFLFMAANRSHNRASFIDKAWQDKVITEPSGRRFINFNGKEIVDSTKFAWDRNDYVLYPTLKLALQYKMLEDIMNYHKTEEIKNDEVKHL